MSKDQHALETALFGKIFGHIARKNLCTSPPPGGWLCKKSCVPFPEILFNPSPLPPGRGHFDHSFSALPWTDVKTKEIKKKGTTFGLWSHATFGTTRCWVQTTISPPPPQTVIIQTMGRTNQKSAKKKSFAHFWPCINTWGAISSWCSVMLKSSVLGYYTVMGNTWLVHSRPCALIRILVSFHFHMDPLTNGGAPRFHLWVPLIGPCLGGPCGRKKSNGTCTVEDVSQPSFDQHGANKPRHLGWGWVLIW